MTVRNLFFLVLIGTILRGVPADQVVLLDRPADSPTWEPHFNPKSVNASVGELIHFVATFEELSQYQSVSSPLE